MFWREGFENTSVPALEQATGLSRSSIYHAFGSKRGLFDEAVRSYLNEVVRPRLRPLCTDPVSADELPAYLDGLSQAFRHVDSTAATSGCLLINAAGAPIAHDPEVARSIADYHQELRHAISRGVRAQLPETDDRERSHITETVTGLVVAAFALVRIDSERAAALLDTARENVASRCV